MKELERNKWGAIINLSFIQIPKTGGTTINNYIITPTVDHYTYEEWFVTGQNKKHKRFNPNEYFIFSFVRNPFDRLYSLYRYKKAYKQKGFNDESPNNRIEFNDWVKALYVDKDEAYRDWRTHTSMWEFLSYGGELQTDFIGRFENYEEDYMRLHDAIGRKRPDSVDQKNIIGGSNSDYRPAYKDETIETVANFYAKDLEVWSYKFQ